jgi:hypothetical protein
LVFSGAPTIRAARTAYNHYFLFISFFFWAGSHKCELKTNGGSSDSGFELLTPVLAVILSEKREK